MALSQYFKDTKTEMRHVSWPTRRQTVVFTLIVIGISLLVAALLGALDVVFSRVLSFFLRLK